MAGFTFEEMARHFANTNEDVKVGSSGQTPKSVYVAALKKAGYSDEVIAQRVQSAYGESKKPRASNPQKASERIAVAH
ncbi:MAG: hypothetical protein FWF11_00260 [Coriobacteriia bacterium]|nr:hypothetical protein [Coriobacteriia bacterium]